MNTGFVLLSGGGRMGRSPEHEESRRARVVETEEHRHERQTLPHQAAFLSPDSGREEGRTALRSALVPLRRLLVDPDASASQHSHLQSSRDLLGLNPQAPLELDLDVVQQAYQQARLPSTPTSREQYAALVTQCQRAVALVRGPFLDVFL